jgi:hypothetical protein
LDLTVLGEEFWLRILENLLTIVAYLYGIACIATLCCLVCYGIACLRKLAREDTSSPGLEVRGQNG